MPLPSKSKISLESLYSMDIKSIYRAYFQEHLSLWCLCIYFFFEYVRPQTLYKVIDILPWAQLFMGLAIITAIVDKSVSWKKHPLNNLFILMALIIFLSGALSFYPEASWDYRNVMLGWLIVYFLTTSIVNTEKRLFLFILAYCLFNLKMSQHGAISWMSRGFSFTSFGLIGSPGWFRNSGEYAIQMLIFGSLVIAFAVGLRSYWGKYKKIILYIIAATGYMTVMGASSRGAQIAMAVMAFWLALKHKNGLKGVIILSAISYLVYLIIPDEQIQRFTEIGDDASSLQRLAYWEAGIELIKQHPVLGIGYSNWMLHVSELYPGGLGPYEVVQVPHSIYVESGSELGLLGLFCFLIMVFYAFKTNYNTRKNTRYMENRFIYTITYGLDAGLIGYLIAGAFVTVFYYPFFWIQIAMIVAVNHVSKTNEVKLKNEMAENEATKK